MSYDSGEFICPKCKSKRMGVYTNWILNKEYFDKYGLKVWIFYYKKSERKCYGWYGFFCPLIFAFGCDKKDKLNNPFFKWFCYIICSLLTILFSAVYLIMYLPVLIWLDICISLCMEKVYTCLYFNYKKYLFDKKNFRQRKRANNILEECFGIKEQDLLEYGKNFFICHDCGKKEDSFYNFIPKEKRDNLAKKYSTNDINEINSLQTEIKVFINTSNTSNSSNTSNISIVFIKPDQSFHCFLSCSIKDTFISIEKELYQKFPDLKNENNYFLCNGIKITEKTKILYELKIKNTDIIVICDNQNPSEIKYEEQKPIISIIFKKQGVLYSLPCTINDKFESIEKRLYQNFPLLKNKNNYFTCNGDIITEKTKTLRELKIKNSDNILINENIMLNSTVDDKELESIISIIFITQDQQFYFSLACKMNVKFEDIEKEICNYPELKNKNIYFTHNGKEITDKKKTLAQLNFINSDQIFICEIEEKKIFSFMNIY